MLARARSKFLLAISKYLKPFFASIGLHYELYTPAPVWHPEWDRMKLSFIMCRKNGIPKNQLLAPINKEIEEQGFVIDGIIETLNEVYSINFDVEAALEGKEAIIEEMYGIKI